MNASNSYNPQGQGQGELFYNIVKYTIIFLVIGLIGYGIYTVYKDTYLTPKKDVIGAKIEEAEKIIEKAKMKTIIKKHFETYTDFVFFVIGLIALLAGIIYSPTIMNNLELLK
jgi:hypothetical protein